MEEVQTLQYTQFPNLNATYHRSETRACLQTDWHERFSSLPDEILILAWAKLLQAFTRVAVPIFIKNGQPISVDISHKNWVRVPVHEIVAGAGSPSHLTLVSGGEDIIHKERATDVSLADANPLSIGPTSLSFQYESMTGYGLLSSSGYVPESFLGELERQFIQMIFSVLPEGHEKLLQLSTAPSPSVLNAKRKGLEGPLFLHELISKHWAETSTAIDFLHADGERVEISYSRLNYVTDDLAHRVSSQLSCHGATPSDTIIPVYIPQSPELYCAWIAILKSNAAFCPIGLDMPHERVKHILKDVGAKIVLTIPKFTSKIARIRADVQVIEVPQLQREIDLVNGYDGSFKSSKVASPDSLAYVMYTSGSTGVPKGVAVPHRAVTQALLAHDEHVPKFDRFLQFAAPTFDVSVFETFFPLFRGATLVSRHREHMLGDLPGTLTALSIDAAELTPTVAGTLLQSRRAAPCLRLLLTIGEMLTQPIIEEFAEGAGRKGILLPMYGPTEASIHCTVAPSMTTETKGGVIGRPLSTVTSLIIQETEESSEVGIEVLPTGQIGELAVAGQLATRYLNQHKQTQVSFRHHPAYGRIYRTGDRARLLPNGDLECLGRISSGQIKIRGQRVELGEIEQVVCKADGIQSAIASIIDDVLVAFCVTSSKNASCEQIMSVCKSWLPSFMRPSDICLFIDNVPRLASGKIDKRKLEADYRTRMQTTTDSPGGSQIPLEHYILSCINAEMPKTVSRTDNLWSCGLDSLRAIRLASRLREEGLWLSVSDILEAENVAALAKSPGITRSTGVFPNKPQIEASAVWDPEDVAGAALPSLFSNIDRNEIETFRPCSPLQIAMLTETSTNSSLNFNSIKIQLPDRVSVPIFCEALQLLAHHNKILRSGFIKTDTQQYPFCQIIWKRLDVKKLDRKTISNGQSEGSDDSGRALLHPLRLQFIDMNEGRVCTIHIHHALYDGWSFELILQDLERLISGQGITRRPQFDDVLKYQLRHRLKLPSNATHTYWQDHLREMRPAKFPKLLTKQILRNGRQACTRAFTLDMDDLNSACQKLLVSRQSLVSAAFAILLSSYVGDPDVVFGTVSSGRAIPVQGIDKIIGPCINTFPMRLDVSKMRTIRDVMLSTHRQYHSFLRFDDIVLAEIKTLSGIAGVDSLFDCLFVWQEGPGGWQKSERSLAIVETFDSLDYSLVLEIEPRDGKLQATVSFEASNLSANHAMLFLKQLDSLLTLFARSPETPVRDSYTNMNTEEMSIENADFCTFERRFTLTSTIETLAKEDPSRTAIEFVSLFDPQSGQLETATINYGELYRRSSDISQSLAIKGVLPDVVISIVMEKSVELYVAILGVIRSGAAYLAIDPRTPADRVRKILEESRCRLVIGEDVFRCSAGSCEFYSTSELESGSRDVSPTTSPSLDIQGDTLAYVVYTSGSMGTPKGVLITRSNVLSNLDCLSRLYPSNSDSKLLQACSQAFDVSVFEIFFTWHMGMSLCVAAKDTLFRDIEHLIRRMNISHLSLTPSVAALIEPENVPNVRFLITAGEPMSSKVFNTWIDRGLYQGYGPSETTNICNVRPKVTLGDFPNNVGPPLPNTSIFICQGQSFSIVPRGAVGEVWIGGGQVGRGYLHDDELTRKSFVNHTTYGRLYRSGDIGRLLADGSLAILGRDDDQVKLRGQRIELGDINQALISSVAVKDAATLIAASASNGDARLVSFWTPDLHVLKGTAEFETQTRIVLRELEGKLPTYMVPDVLIPINQLPLTRQGKINRRTLLKQFESYDQSLLQCFCRASEEEDDDNRALSKPEELIAQAVAEVVGCVSSAIRRDASFFALGMDSIKAIRISQRLSKVGFGQVDISKILCHASVRRLATYLSSSTSTSVQAVIEASQKPTTGRIFNDEWQRHVRARFADLRYKVAKILPCTALQEAMLSSHDIHSSDSYRNRLVFRVSGDLAELKLCWKAILHRHQLLKTGFAATVSTASAFAQVVLEEFDLPWSWDDTQPGQDLGDQLHEGCILPPYSLRAIQGGDGGGSTLTLRIHHALYDGEAMNLLLAEVETQYLAGRLPPVVPFDHYLEYMLSLEPRSTDNFWRRQLDGYKSQLVTEIFSVATQENGPTHFATGLVSNIPLSTLQAKLKLMSTTLLTIVQTSWTRLLSFYLRTFDVCFGNVYSGRTIPVQDADQIIGPCFNTLPVRVKLKRLQTIADLSRRLQETNTAVLPYQPSSLRRILKSHGATERPLFDTLLMLQPALHPLNGDIWALTEETGNMDFPVICEIVPDAINDQLLLKLHVQVGQFPVAEARRLLENLDLLLENDLQYTQTSSRDFSILKENVPFTLRDPKIRPKSPSSLKRYCPEDSVEEAFSTLEAKIRQMLSEASKTDIMKIKKLTSIFQLGLDSIDAVQIAAKLRREGFNVTGGDVLEACNVRGIVELCSRRSASPKNATPLFDLMAFDARYRSSVCERINVPPSSIEAILPCTSAQSGILAEFVHSDGRFYFNSLMLRLKGVVNINRLKEAWSKVISRHEMLRTGFVEIENAAHPFAMVTYRIGIHQLPWNESAGLGDVLRNDMDGKGILESLHQPSWYLLYSEQAGDCHLKLSILHALYDAQSLDLILANVASLYSGDHLPPSEGIQSTLSSILSESMTQSQESKSFFTSLWKSLQPTRFPDLRIYSNKLRGASVIARPLTKSQHELRQGCKQTGMSLQTAVQCAWAQLLAAYTGEPDVTFGVVLSGYASEKMKDSVAFPTMNTLPMALHVSEDAEDLVRQASKLNASLMQRQFVPLTQINKWLDVKESLFDTIVVLQRHPSLSHGIAFWEVVSEDAQTEHTVSLEVVPDSQDSVTLHLTFQRNVLPPEQAKILLSQFEALIYTTIFPPHAGTEISTRRRSELFSIIPAKDGRIASSTRFLHEMAEQSAQKWPEQIALEFATSISGRQVSKRCWSYKSLDQEANRIAHLLVQQGALPGNLIGICFEKCPEASFAILGILKAGCAFVAIDPNAPEARKDFILRDAACTTLLCNKDKVNIFGHNENLSVLALDDNIDLSQMPSESPQLLHEIKPEDTCYCLYTSGTTGQPKGCLISHDNAVQALLCFQRIFAGHWNDDSRWLQFASFHFDVSVLEQFWSWSIGICVTSAPRDLLFEDLPGAITALQITHLDLTPSLARLLKPEEVPSLCRGVFITGGEQLRQDVLDIWGDVGVLYNFYGPSEVTIGCTVHQKVPKAAKPSNIGLQFDNVGTFVLDLHTKQPVLRGGIGELCLSGPLVGKGYLNRPQLTEAKFEYIPDFDVRIYHTGDLVRLLHDGSFEFLGRSDDQVKLRGQRLEIGEINHVLAQSDSDLRDVATMVMRHPNQINEHLVSFLSWSERSTRAANPTVLQDDKVKAKVTAIRQISEGRLPGYMVPTFFVPVSVMPLSSNNKVELNILKVLFAETTMEDLRQLSTITEGALYADQSSINKIMSLLSKRFGLAAADIRPTSSLFELGMDSISVIGFARSLRDVGFDAAQPSLVMRHSTIAGLALALKSPSETNWTRDQLQKDAFSRIASFAAKHRDYIAQTLGIQDGNIEKIAPCTPLQEGMIFRTLLADIPVYAPTFTYDLSDGLDLHGLHIAWLSAQAQNSILRTKFTATQEGFAQVVLHNSDAQNCIIVNCQKDEDNGEEFEHDLKGWYESVRTLESMPWRVVLKEEQRRKVMIIHIFHALFDGISLPLLLEKVAQNYLGQELDMTGLAFHDILPFGPLCVTAGAKAFWQKAFASKSLSLLNLPMRHLGNGESGSCVETSSVPHLEALDWLRFKLKVTMPALFHACWLLVLHKHFSIVPTLGIVVSGRGIDIESAQNVVGPLFNTLPCLIQFGAGLSLSDLVEACHSFNLDSLPFQHTALRDISKWIGQDLSQPLFDSLFVFQKEAEGLLASSKLWTARESTSEPDFPLAVEVQQNRDHSFTVTVAAHPQYLDRQDVHTLSLSFTDLIYKMLENPDQPLPVHKGIQNMRDVRASALAEINPSTNPFLWTPEANLIRQEVAGLANAEAEAIRASSTIFEVGLDSIDAIKLSARLKAVGISIPVGEIMKTGTIEAMAEACVRKATTGLEEASSQRFDRSLAELKISLRSQGVAVDEYEKVLPATPLQEGMLANFEQYCSQDVLELKPEVEIRQLRAAWANVLYANPILRTSFAEVKDPDSSVAYAQLVHNVSSKHEVLQAINWRELTVEAEPNLDDVIMEQQMRMVGQGLRQPSLDLSVVSMRTRRFLVLGMAHAIYDGWSIDLLHQDVEHSYGGNAVERPPYEPALRRILDDQNGTSQRFWKDILRRVSPSLFPHHANEQKKPALTVRDQIRSRFRVGDVQDFCKAQGVTAQALGLTCYSIVLGGLLEKLDVCFGLVLSGRTTDSFDDVMFPTMNTVVFSTTLESSRKNMLKVAHDRVRQISEHQFFPLRKAKKFSGVEGALFDALFIYQKRPQSDRHYPQLYHTIQTSSSIEYPVNVEMEFDGNDLLWRAACKDTVLPEGAVARMIADLDRALDEVMRCPNEPVVEPIDTKLAKICGIWTINHQLGSGDPKTEGEHAVPTTLVTNAPPKASLATSGELAPWTPLTTTLVHKDSEELGAEKATEWSFLERLIRDVLASVSGYPPGQISKKTSLFSLGLDSITSIKVSSILRGKSISLPVSVMLTAPSIEKMAAAATQVGLSRSDSQPYDPEDRSPLIAAPDYERALEQLRNAGVSPENIESVLPVTAGQDYVLGVWRASGGRLFYSDFYYKSTDPGLTSQKLEKAWTETVQQLPILRTTFIICGGHQILQVQMKPDTIFTMRKDASLSIPVQLTTETLSSGLHIKLSIHHALYDAVSLRVITSLLEKYCCGNVYAVETNVQIDLHKRTASSLHTELSDLGRSVPSLDRLTFRNTVEDGSTDPPSSSALNALITTTRNAAAVPSTQEFWTNYLPANEKSLPMGRPFLSFASRRVEHYRPRLLGSVVEAERIARDHDLSFQSLFLAAYAFAHASHILPSGIDTRVPDRVTIGVYLANRSLDIDGLLELAHPTFSVVPLRIKLSGSIFGVAERIQRDLGQIGQAQNCGVLLHEIYEWSGVRIDCCVNFLKLPDMEGNGGESEQQPYFEPVARLSWEEDADALPPPPRPPPFTGSTPIGTSEVFLPSIDVEASVRDGGLDVGIFAPVDLLNEQTAMKVLGELQSLLSTTSLTV